MTTICGGRGVISIGYPLKICEEVDKKIEIFLKIKDKKDLSLDATK